MHEVPFGDETASIDLSALRHVGPPAGWAGLWPHGGRDVALWIDGDERGPLERLVALARVALPRLDAIERASDAYLREFVRHADDFYRGQWRVRSARFAWPPGSRLPAGDEFEATLSVAEDDYGEWAVRFVRDTYPARAFRPFAFSRTQR